MTHNLSFSSEILSYIIKEHGELNMTDKTKKILNSIDVACIALKQYGFKVSYKIITDDTCHKIQISYTHTTKSDGTIEVTLP
jgi:hypothetical protein